MKTEIAVKIIVFGIIFIAVIGILLVTLLLDSAYRETDIIEGWCNNDEAPTCYFPLLDLGAQIGCGNMPEGADCPNKLNVGDLSDGKEIRNGLNHCYQISAKKSEILNYGRSGFGKEHLETFCNFTIS